MSGDLREPDVTVEAVLGARLTRAVSESVGDPSGVVRLLVVGPRGSSKSAVLALVAEAAGRRGRSVHDAASAADLAAVDADTVVVVDDLHALAPQVVASVLRRAEDPRASLVVATRPRPQDAATTRIVSTFERTHPALVVGRVSRADVLDHGEGLAPTCTDWILEATGGVTWLVSAALRAHDARDCREDPEHRELADRLRETIAHRLTAVDEEIRLAVQHAEDGSGDATAEALQRAHAEGLLLPDGRAAPIVRAVSRGLRSRSVAERAAASYAAGDLDAAASLAEAGLARPDAADRDALVAVAAATWAARGMMTVGARLHDLAPPAARDTGAVIVGFGTGSGAAAPEVDSDAPSDLPSTLRIAGDLLTAALAATLRPARADAAVAMLARASQLTTASGSTAPLPELPAVIAAAAAQSHGDLAAARAVIDAALAGSQGGPAARPRLLVWRAWLALHEVRAADARESLAMATAAAPRMCARDEVVAHAVRLGLARRSGDPTALATAWESARPALAAVDVDVYLVQPLTEFLATAAKVRDVEATDAHTAATLQVLAGLGEPALWSVPLRWAAVQRGILLNAPESLAPHAHALLLASGHSPVAAAMAAAGRVWTTVLAGTAEPDAVDAAATSLARFGLTWDAARLAGSAAAASADRRVAARLLARARDIHPLQAAPPVHAAAADAGQPTAPAAPAAPSRLSRRETDVARLVVDGKTYAEIGAAIFISPRTAEHHVASIRRRLGATSRSDLIAKLRAALDPALDGTRAVA